MKKSIRTSVVGIKHQTFPLSTISKIKNGELISVKAEPLNKHDSSAVAVYADGYQIGYIRALHAKVISPALRFGDCSAIVTVISPEEVPPNPDIIEVSVCLSSSAKKYIAPKVGPGKICGIYRITVNSETYIGQSTDINKRLVTHWKNLAMGVHGNKHLQKLWAELGPQAFKVEALFIAPSGLSPYELQEWLGRQEYARIEEHRVSGDNINILDGDIVLTKPAAADKSQVVAKRIKAHDEAVRLRKNEINAEITKLTADISPTNVERRKTAHALQEARKALKKNTGITGLFFGSLSRDQTDMVRSEIARLEAIACQLDGKLKPAAEKLSQLRITLKSLKTAKQKAQAANRSRHHMIRFEPSDFV